MRTSVSGANRCEAGPEYSGSSSGRLVACRPLRSSTSPAKGDALDHRVKTSCPAKAASGPHRRLHHRSHGPPHHARRVTGRHVAALRHLRGRRNAVRGRAQQRPGPDLRLRRPAVSAHAHHGRRDARRRRAVPRRLRERGRPRRLLRHGELHDHEDLRPDAAPQRPDARPGRAAGLGCQPRRRRQHAGRHRRRAQGVRGLDHAALGVPVHRRRVRGGHQRAARRRLHGRERDPHQRGLLLRLRQRRGAAGRQRRGAHGRRQPGNQVLLPALHGPGPMGRGRHGGRAVPGRQRQRHGEHRQFQFLRHGDAEERRTVHLRAEGRRRPEPAR
ncbi:hypothetical protein ABH935_008232 [Catenulispora sp. GAS73]